MADPSEGLGRAARGAPLEQARIDTSKASIARVYDYHLGGKDNYPVDRAAGDAVIEAVPDVVLLARANRAFLRRAVRYLVNEAGIRQIIDIGSGLPTRGNVHEIAHEIDPSVRVVYVDNDPVVLAHGRALLADNDTTTVITADLREPDAIFEHRDTRRFINEDEPFAVLLAAVLHHLEDEEDPHGIVASVRDRLPSGGYLLVANIHDTGEERAREFERSFIEGGLGTGRCRSWADQRRFFDGLELVDPGLVSANEWRPDIDMQPDTPAHPLYIGGVGRKP